ncbi:MAPEG family protein [Asticcacaulis tiandongensis]|uniref:MAPEG family protein n=1 Tax=Asticcacaulis tiandongensis TaxID=2565365 RepID=UPI001128C3EE|nr:MAPEG family protein [Asticcacaulis tiandongensis]
MTQELWVLVLAAIWGLIQILVAAASPMTQKGYWEWNASPRDTPFDLGPVPARLRRAYQNYLETFPFIAALIVVTAIVGHSDTLSQWGAWLYLGARLLYFPAYGAGTKLRSPCYLVSLVGIGLVAVSVIGSAL